MSLVKNPFAVNDEQADYDVPAATLAIYRGIAEHLSRRDDTSINRASAATMCVRRRWYQKTGTPGIPITPRKIINFALGDLSEMMVIHFIKEFLVGPDKLYSEVSFGEKTGSIVSNGKEICTYKQPTYTWTISPDLIITARVDGLGRRNLDGQWELIECKSAASYGFDEFKEHGPGDYINQAHACMMTAELQALGVKSVRYFYLKKETGHLWDRLEFFNEETAGMVRQSFISATRGKIPERPYGYVAETYRRNPTGRSKLPWQCGYCPFVSTCHPEAIKEFSKSNKPAWYKPQTEGEVK